MIALSSLKQKRVHQNIDSKPKPSNSSFALSQSSLNYNEKKIKPVGKKALMMDQTPILSFTSFQSYLQGCNQNSFYKKQNQRVFRSQQKHKTQQNFNLKKHISGSTHTKKHRFSTDQNNNQISPFQPDKQINFCQYNSQKFNRKVHSKSQSSNYNLQKSSSFAQRFLHQKLGTIKGWDQSQQKSKNKNKQNVNNTILKQRSVQNKEKNEISRKKSTKKKNVSSQEPQSQSIRKKSAFLQNKQNFAQILPDLVSRQKKTPKSDQNQLNYFRKSYKREFTQMNCLTQINELEQEILLSKRQDIITHRSNKNALRSINCNNEESNILRLKKQAEYLCNQQEDNQITEFDASDDKENMPLKNKYKSITIQPDGSNHCSNRKTFKPFVKFPTYSSHEKSHIDMNAQNMCNRTSMSFVSNQNSSGAFQILQPINSNQQNFLYEPRTPIKHSNNLKNYGKITGTESDMKNATRNRQKFHNSIKQRKSKSVFNSISKNQSALNNKQITKINPSQLINTKNGEQDKLLMTIVNSFHSVKNNNQSKIHNKHNLSLTKSINASINKMQNESKRLHTSESCHYENDDTNFTSKCKDISEFLTETDTVQFSFQQSVPISFKKQQASQNNFQSINPPQPLQDLSKLSQEMKKMAKLSTPISLSTKYNKKFHNFSKSIKNNKHSFKSSNFGKNQQIENLCISSLQGRQIHKLKKITEIEN